jgi:hypothetical protein
VTPQQFRSHKNIGHDNIKLNGDAVCRYAAKYVVRDEHRSTESDITLLFTEATFISYS